MKERNRSKRLRITEKMEISKIEKHILRKIMEVIKGQGQRI
jgi:hypothetical protein